MNNFKVAVLSLTALVLIGATSLVVQAQSGFVWESFKPDKRAKPVKALVMGKRLNYYPLEKGDNIYITLTGPTKLRVLSRIEFGSDLGGEKSYYLRYEREDGKKGKFRRVTTASTTAMLAGDPSTHLGTSRSIYIKIPAGKHTYRFYVGSKSTYRLYLRFYERKASLQTSADNIAFTPAKFTREVPLIIKEEEVSYYRVGSQDSLTLSVIGPTSIKALARLEFDPTMSTDQKFRVRVLEDGVEKQVFPLRSEPSEVAEYCEMSETVVGKGAKFFIEVPRGKHDYTYEIIDNGRSVLMRFFLPSKDIHNNL